ncbi:MAG: acyl carrier protein [Waddliaceae bacterium]
MKLKQAFRNALDLAENADMESLAFAKSEGWDSIAHMKLIAEIEEAFDIMIDTDDVLAMGSYVIAKKRVEKYVGKNP